MVWPAGTLVQVPRLPATAHERHVPLQAVAQQTPCSQKPLEHSPAVVQVVPVVLGIWHAPPTQTLGVAQSAEDVQLVRHMGRVGAQAKPLHDTGAGVAHRPEPSQVRAGVSVLFVHCAGQHIVPAAWRRQARAPSHSPSRPQVMGSSRGHSSPGSAPAGIGAQVPSLPVTLQASHLPAHAALQQTPSTQ
jgi:hypothetical protein